MIQKKKTPGDAFYKSQEKRKGAVDFNLVIHLFKD